MVNRQLRDLVLMCLEIFGTNNEENLLQSIGRFPCYVFLHVFSENSCRGMKTSTASRVGISFKNSPCECSDEAMKYSIAFTNYFLLRLGLHTLIVTHH